MPHDEIDALVDALRTWIREKDRSEASVAKKLGVSRQRLNLWMHGEARPTAEAYLKIKAFMRWRK
jgi:transcriptional regulator with XRE-family HTH domain